MLPVLYRFVFETDFLKLLLLVVAAGLVAYAARSGWKNAEEDQRLTRALQYGVVGVGLAAALLYYAMPATVTLPFLGTAKGEGLPLHTYGLLIGAGFISAVTASAWMAVREWPGELGLKRRDQVFDLAFYLFIGGIVGSRVLFVMVNWKDYAAQPSKIFSLGGGLVFYGGLIGAAIAALWYSRKHGIEFLRLADIAVPTVSLGQAFGRLGCFSAGCCWGDVTTHERAPFAVEFPGAGLVRDLFGNLSNTPSLAFASQSDATSETRWVVEKTGEVTAQAVEGSVRISEWAAQHHHTLPVHPTQLYESVGQIILFVTLLTMRRFRRFHGQIFALYLMCYAVLRTTVETFRGDLERGTLHGLIDSVPFNAWYNISTSQFISLCMFSFGAWLLVKNFRELKSQPQVDLAALTAA